MQESSVIINQWLKSIKGVGNRWISNLRNEFSDEKIMKMTYKELSNYSKNEKLSRDIINNRNFDKHIEYLEELKTKGIRLIDYKEDLYPELLREIYDYPVDLHVLGNIELLSSKKVSVIGTRRPTEEGRKIAREVGRLLSGSGYTVVSGMAGGIDSEAHKGALEGYGSTIAVLGSSIDICYPACNRDIYNEIIKKGLIVSEYNIPTKPLSYNFPRRNRIISGLCDSIIVIEAGISSGTLITVSQGLEQGKTIYAFPGSIFSSKSEGTNYLIREGAIPINSLNDLELYFDLSPKEEISNLTDVQKTIIKYINLNQPVYISNFSIDLNLTGGIITRELLNLQLLGVISKLPGNKYITY
ncbi:MAG: DNA-processing protein DprA [Acidaminobacteraceae bacterium]